LAKGVEIVVKGRTVVTHGNPELNRRDFHIGFEAVDRLETAVIGGLFLREHTAGRRYHGALPDSHSTISTTATMSSPAI